MRFWSRFKTQDTRGKVKMGKMCGMERGADGFESALGRVWGGFVIGVEWVRYWLAGGGFCHLRVRFEAFSNGFLQL